VYLYGGSSIKCEEKVTNQEKKKTIEKNEKVEGLINQTKSTCRTRFAQVTYFRLNEN